MNEAAGEGRVFRVGVIFRDNFRVDGILGAGLHGEVYKVSHVHTGVSFALKVMHLEDSQHAGKVRRALSTAKAAYRIQHANVVQVHDLGCEPDGRVWVLMELLEGRSLAALLAPRKPLGVLFAYAVAIEIAWGLAAAHEAQVIHRDVKPDNVFLTADGMVKLLDFSIAKYLPDGVHTTRRQSGMGTPAYMAPDNLAGGEPTPGFDIYSLGLVLWEMVVGRHPYEDALRSTSEMFRRQHSTPVVPLSLAARLPDYVDTLIDRATAKAPAARFATIVGMARALVADRERLETDALAQRVRLERVVGLPLEVRGPLGHAEYHAQRAPDADPPPPLPSQRVVVRAGALEDRPDRTLPLPGAVGPAGTLPLGAVLPSRPASAAGFGDDDPLAPSRATERSLAASSLTGLDEDRRETPQALVHGVDNADAVVDATEGRTAARSRFARLAPLVGLLLVVPAVLVVALGRTGRDASAHASKPTPPTAAAPSPNLPIAAAPSPSAEVSPTAAPDGSVLSPPAVTASAPSTPPVAAPSARPPPNAPQAGARWTQPAPSAKFKPLFDF